MTGAATMELTRRALLQGAAATVVALAPGVTLLLGPAPSEARAPGTPVSAKTRWGLLVDVSRYAEVADTVVEACRTENGWTGHGRPLTDPQWVRNVTLNDPRTGAVRTLPVMCQHCEHPPCVDVCPTGASFRRADGVVLVDKHICIGCRYCMMACPFGVRFFVHENVTGQKPHAPRGKGTVESCTLCVHRLDAGRRPACVEAAERKSPGAMIFGDLNDPNSEIARAVGRHVALRLRADLGLDQGVFYKGLNG
ncbi:MAG: 4Fe-4S dicluster domain-containing protein [Rhodospirillales bacterium]|nr:4Fe-4S dicluster domain-containing protein [Rhodospirillales bacterium]